MIRTSLSIASGLAAALVLVSAPGAQAAVSAKDAPSKGDIVKQFPELADGEFRTDKNDKVAQPGDTCGTTALAKAKSAVATTGVSATGQPVVQAGVAEVKSSGQAKTYLASYKTYVKKCATFTEPTTGATITTSLTKAPKLGQAALAIVQETSIAGAHQLLDQRARARRQAPRQRRRHRRRPDRLVQHQQAREGRRQEDEVTPPAR